jgi:type II secretory pathway pseudopilin PulG
MRLILESGGRARLSERMSRRKPRRRAAFTLFEVLVAMPLVIMIMLGTMSIYTLATQLFARTTAQLYTSMDSSNAIQHVIDETREAQSYALPAENTFVTPTGWTASQFYTTYNGQTINTGIELNIPPALTPQAVGYQTGNPSTVSVINSAGTTVSVPSLTYANGTSTQRVIIYRGDPPAANGIGAPNSNPSGATTTAAFVAWKAAQVNLQSKAGTYLWEYNCTTGVDTVLCKSIAWSPDACQFIRPTTTPGVAGGTPQAFEVEINIVSGYYSPINLMTTNEESNGSEVSNLTGKCVYMRDHQTAASTPTNANTSATNNAIQYSP